ncbi:MAG: DUF523 and DUF1722 domain-containing protein [Nitrospirae bacterium]|nr:DUF523 and DUF1722 domain-containing protein [Nitrospirota bacterium]
MSRSSSTTFDDLQPPPLRLGISQCLLGEQVRFDGGHKRNQFLVDILGQHVEWIPVCPEVEAGFGTPREPMRLVDDLDQPRLITIRAHQDHTAQMTRYTKRRLRDLRSLNLCGYVFKKDSPSCGTQRVRVYNQEGKLLGKGKGIFAEAFQRTFPLIPIEEEGRLQDPGLRENFIERVFGYHRWQAKVSHARLTRGALVAFHATQKYLLLAHSRRHYQQLGQLVANAKQFTPRQLVDSYGQLFMEALAVKTTIRKHMNVLQHLAGHLKSKLSPLARAELHAVLHDYHQAFVPLSVPITLIRHYVRVFEIPYLADQVYLSPHPKELMLRNHV